MKSPSEKRVSRRGQAICFGLVFVLSAVPLRGEGILWRYVIGAGAAKEQRAAQVIADQQAMARQAIEKSMELLQSAYEDYHVRVLMAQKAVEQAKRDVEGALPEEMKTGTMPVPLAVKKYEWLWENLSKCQKADARFKERVDELLAKAREADSLTAQDEATTDALGQLANDLNGAYSSLLRGKWLTDAQIKVKRIEKDASMYTKDARASIKVEVDKRKFEEAKKAKEGTEAAKKAAEEEARKNLIAEEEAKAQEAFDELSGELKAVGNWSSCMRKLNRLKERMRTKEGQAAAEVQLKKVEFMEGLRKFFAENAKGFRFKDRRGNVAAIVTESNDKAFTIQKQKYVAGEWSPDKSTTVPWDEFYTLNDQVKKYSDFKGQFSGYMNQFIMELVINGRINGREQSEHLLGAALTLKYLHGDKPGVDKFIPHLVKAAVDGIKGERGWKDMRGFGPNRKWAVKWFPDVELSEVEDPVE